MSELVDPAQIEEIVGAGRHRTEHIGRMDTRKKRIYILHSEVCMEQYGQDLRHCPYSLALDDGIAEEDWGLRDRPVYLSIDNLGVLTPGRAT